MLRTNVNEMNVDAVDLGHEHGQRVQSRLHLAPVVVGAPVAHDLLEFRELRALRSVVDGLLVRPPRGGDAPAKIDEVRFRNMDGERADRAVFAQLRGRDGRRHGKQTDNACGCRSSEHVAPCRRSRLLRHDSSSRDVSEPGVRSGFTIGGCSLPPPGPIGPLRLPPTDFGMVGQRELWKNVQPNAERSAFVSAGAKSRSGDLGHHRRRSRHARTALRVGIGALQLDREFRPVNTIRQLQEGPLRSASSRAIDRP